MNNINLIELQGFDDDNKTLNFIYNPNCNSNYTNRNVDGTITVLVNTPDLIINSLDCITKLMVSDELNLYIVKEDFVGLSSLYRIIDSPELLYDPSTRQFKETLKYFYDKNRDVCIAISDNTQYTHYAQVVNIYVTRTPDKINHANKFIYHHCTTEPAVFIDDLSPSAFRDKYPYGILNDKDS